MKTDRLLSFEHLVPGVQPDDIQEIAHTSPMLIDCPNFLNSELGFYGSLFNTYVLLTTPEAVERWQKAKSIWDNLKQNK